MQIDRPKMIQKKSKTKKDSRKWIITSVKSASNKNPN